MIYEKQNIGLVIPPNTYLFSPWAYNYYFTELLRGSIAAASLMGWNILIYHRGLSGEQSYAMFQEKSEVDGMVVLSPKLSKMEIKELKSLNKPLIIINGRYPGISFTDSDNIKGAQEAVNYLIKKGHKKIAVINGKISSINGAHRYEGFKKAMSSKKIEIKDRLVRYGDFTEDSGYLETKELLKIDAGDQPTAVFCANDLMAVGALKALKEKKKRVPKDVSVIGFDDLIICAYTDPPLTTVRQPLFHLGKEAVINLISIIMEEKNPYQEIIVKTRLIERESVAPPKK
ncbi:MAG: LacI family DNA-binding transcriptional regulator [Elusimicrobiota bacterium]